MIEYLVDGDKYRLSYYELREQYSVFCQMPDDVFVKRLPEALHLACVICWLKEVPSYVCLSDKGIIHELIHLLHIPEENTASIQEVRKLFELWLVLA